MVSAGMRGRIAAEIELLRTVPAFSWCSREELDALAAEADEVSVDEGTTLIRQGERGHELIVLVDGSADVWKNGCRINRLAGGDFVGEISLFAEAAPTATVTTTSRSRLLLLSERGFKRAVEQVPSVRASVLHAVSERLQADARR
jgi:CRP/FNR family transcriptional regulator, cyclic AMP receptor protein